MTSFPIPLSGATLLLLDPTFGAVGMADQIQAAANYIGTTHIVALDVGGDAGLPSNSSSS